MEIESILTNSKWDILKELSKNPKSPIELATQFKTTIANISQQLKILEALGVVSKTKIFNSEKGKPRMQYYIVTDLTYIIKISKNQTVKQSIKKDACSNLTLNTILTVSKKDQFYILKLYFDNFEILSNSSIGYFKTTDKTIELFLITNEIEHARKKISNIEYPNSEGIIKKIVIWSHNKQEIDEGIKNKDLHFLNLIKESEILLDETSLLQKYKESLSKE